MTGIPPLVAPQHASATVSDPLAILHDWADKGWLRRLDSALASFMRELDSAATPTLLVSTAVLAQMEGRGHTCLPLRLLVSRPDEILAWPPAAQEDLNALWTTLPTSLSDWLEALKISPLVRSVTLALTGETTQNESDHGQPLVLGGTLDEPLLYLRRYWLHECQVAGEVLQRTAASQDVDEGLARQWLDRLFSQTDSAGANSAEVDWQKLACAVALRASLTVITGGPGTGKTYTAARLLALLFAMDANPQRLRVALAAPTGKAAARLRQSIDASLQELNERLGDDIDLETFTKRIGAARTLHSLLGARPDTRQFRFNASHLLDVDILIVDEASMIHLEMMSALLQAMPPGAKLILLGDKDQLASVEAGAVLGDLCRDAASGHYDLETARYAQAVAGQTLPAEFLATDAPTTPLAQQTVMLRKSRRFGGLIGQLALAVNGGNCELAQTLITNDETDVLQATYHPSVDTVLNLAVHGRPGARACFADYLQLIGERPAQAFINSASHDIWVKSILVAFERFRLLCAVHEGDWGTRNLNQTVQKALSDAGLLKPKGEWFAGRPVMVTRNDPELGVFNGDVGVTLPGTRGSTALRVYFLDGDSLRSVGVSRLAHVETAFAMTVHKCQGSEFLHTALVLPQGGAKILTRELVYTGITRARESFTLIEGQEGLLQGAIERKSQRASGLGMQLERSRIL
ncbi:MAG: exodeoxyribonuclease V subunit alpha [Burkholderiaceae bacterium]|nr:exodeoxyribonuclease V subunit alpha [Burkholderiaceae bacterium]